MTDPITDNFLHKVSNKPILLVGPTASGKSKLAMSLAIKLKRHIVNADSLQVYSNWRILTARPTSEDEKIIQHHLYGHKAPDEEYSVGHWLRELSEILKTNKNLIIVGGTGLYFTALTEGLVNIPKISKSKFLFAFRHPKYQKTDRNSSNSFRKNDRHNKMINDHFLCIYFSSRALGS